MTVVINGSTGIDKVQDGVVTDGKLNLTANSAEIKEALNAGGSAPIYACRAWVNFNGTGTVAIRASGNVSSITDNGTGNYTVNFTTAMPDANYCLSANGSYDISGSTPTNYTQTILKQGSGYNTASSCRISTVYATGTSGGPADFDYVSMAIFR